jgi:hypothetical protein
MYPLNATFSSVKGYYLMSSTADWIDDNILRREPEFEKKKSLGNHKEKLQTAFSKYPFWQ